MLHGHFETIYFSKTIKVGAILWFYIYFNAVVGSGNPLYELVWLGKIVLFLYCTYFEHSSCFVLYGMILEVTIFLIKMCTRVLDEYKNYLDVSI